MDKRMPAFVLCLAALVLAAASFLRLMRDPKRAAESVVAFCGDGCGAHRGGGGLSHLPYPQ